MRQRYEAICREMVERPEVFAKDAHLYWVEFAEVFESGLKALEQGEKKYVSSEPVPPPPPPKKVVPTPERVVSDLGKTQFSRKYGKKRK